MSVAKKDGADMNPYSSDGYECSPGDELFVDERHGIQKRIVRGIWEGPHSASHCSRQDYIEFVPMQGAALAYCRHQCHKDRRKAVEYRIQCLRRRINNNQLSINRAEREISGLEAELPTEAE